MTRWILQVLQWKNFWKKKYEIIFSHEKVEKKIEKTYLIFSQIKKSILKKKIKDYSWIYCIQKIIFLIFIFRFKNLILQFIQRIRVFEIFSIRIIVTKLVQFVKDINFFNEIWRNMNWKIVFATSGMLKTDISLQTESVWWCKSV